MSFPPEALLAWILPRKRTAKILIDRTRSHFVISVPKSSLCIIYVWAEHKVEQLDFNLMPKPCLFLHDNDHQSNQLKMCRKDVYWIPRRWQCWCQHCFGIFLNPHIKIKGQLDRQGQKTVDEIYNKIMLEGIPKNPQIQAMGQTTKSPKTSIQEKAVDSNRASDGSENWKSPKQP